MHPPAEIGIKTIEISQAVTGVVNLTEEEEGMAGQTTIITINQDAKYVKSMVTLQISATSDLMLILLQHNKAITMQDLKTLV